ncbi:MAG: PDZ domain-containing protein [Bacteroidales bacterium]
MEPTTQKNAYVEVNRIIPGSPSWKQGELEVGDFILKVAQGDEEPVDIVDMRLDEAVQLIRGKKGTEARLTIKKLMAPSRKSQLSGMWLYWRKLMPNLPLLRMMKVTGILGT